jgi:hypothetical protein
MCADLLTTSSEQSPQLVPLVPLVLGYGLDFGFGLGSCSLANYLQNAMELNKGIWLRIINLR